MPTQPAIIIGAPVVTQPSVIIIGAPVANPVGTQPSVITIGEPAVPTSGPVVIVQPSDPVISTPIPVGEPVVVVPPVVSTVDPSVTGVVSFTLVNVDTGEDILTLGNGMILDMASLGVRKITIRADTQGTIGSVVFGWDTNVRFKIENTAPYKFYDDTGHNNYAWPYTLGLHTLTATAYSSVGGSGTALETLSIQFILVKTDSN